MWQTAARKCVSGRAVCVRRAARVPNREVHNNSGHPLMLSVGRAAGDVWSASWKQAPIRTLRLTRGLVMIFGFAWQQFGGRKPWISNTVKPIFNSLSPFLCQYLCPWTLRQCWQEGLLVRKSHTLGRKRQHPTQTFKSTEGCKVLTETHVKMVNERPWTVAARRILEEFVDFQLH